MSCKRIQELSKTFYSVKVRRREFEIEIVFSHKSNKINTLLVVLIMALSGSASLLRNALVERLVEQCSSLGVSVERCAPLGAFVEQQKAATQKGCKYCGNYAKVEQRVLKR